MPRQEAKTGSPSRDVDTHVNIDRRASDSDESASFARGKSDSISGGSPAKVLAVLQATSKIQDDAFSSVNTAPSITAADTGKTDLSLNGPNNFALKRGGSQPKQPLKSAPVNPAVIDAAAKKYYQIRFDAMLQGANGQKDTSDALNAAADALQGPLQNTSRYLLAADKGTSEDNVDDSINSISRPFNR